VVLAELGLAWVIANLGCLEAHCERRKVSAWFALPPCLLCLAALDRALAADKWGLVAALGWLAFHSVLWRRLGLRLGRVPA
jgi:hypothetical protein